MVLFSTLFLAATASLSAAYPSKVERSSALVARGSPATGDELTMRKTKNNLDDGSFSDDGGEIKFKVGDKVGEGSAGQIFTIDCGEDNADCDDVGAVVLKYYTDNDQVEDEQKHLAKIDELKAVVTNDDDHLTLMTKWDGANFSKLPKYNELLGDEEANKQAIIDLLDSAIEKTIEDGKAYLGDHYIFHDDINDANVLMQESDGKVTGAKLVDWDKASIIPSDISDEDMEGLKKEMEGVVKTAFDRFRPE